MGDRLGIHDVVDILAGKIFLSEVGFEPTPSYEDQKSLYYSLSREQGMYLESGALDHSAILTGLLIMENFFN